MLSSGVMARMSRTCSARNAAISGPDRSSTTIASLITRLLSRSGRDPQHAQYRRLQGLAEFFVGQVGQVTQALRDEEQDVEGEPLGAGAGFNGALLIVAQDVRGPADTQQIAAALAKLPDVAKVAPVTTQNGISLIKLIPQSGPSDPATTALVHTIRDDRAAIEGQTGAHILVGGTTASNIDVSAKLSAALPIFLAVVVGLAFILLTFAFRTILVPITSILGFLLSMAAALGLQVAMFQWGWGQHIFGITPAATISFLPIIMLAIIFGLSSDYEVFVVSRIKEEYTKNGDARRAVRRYARSPSGARRVPAPNCRRTGTCSTYDSRAGGVRSLGESPGSFG